MKIVFTKTITVNDSAPINISAVFSGDYQKQPEKWQLNSIVCDNEIDLLPNLNERGKAWITKRTLKDARNLYRRENKQYFSLDYTHPGRFKKLSRSGFKNGVGRLTVFRNKAE